MEKLDRKEREHLAHRKEILAAAEKVFAAKGFFRTTMNEIAEVAEFWTGTLYKYFSSKEDLYFTLIDVKTEEINRFAKVELSRKTSVKERVERVLRLQFAFIEERGFMIRWSLLLKSSLKSSKRGSERESLNPWIPWIWLMP